MKVRRPRKKKLKYEFVRRIVEIAVGDPLRFREVQEMYCLGDFGYHQQGGEERLWAVTYLPTGQCIYRIAEEKQAKILCKRLFVKVKSLWKPSRQDLLNYYSFLKEAEEVVSAWRRSLDQPPVYVDRKLHDGDPANYDDDDIPF